LPGAVRGVGFCPADIHEAGTEVELRLDRIADLQHMQLHRVVALPEWRDA